jgi:hypothetical protein
MSKFFIDDVPVPWGETVAVVDVDGGNETKAVQR